MERVGKMEMEMEKEKKEEKGKRRCLNVYCIMRLKDCVNGMGGVDVPSCSLSLVKYAVSMGSCCV